MPKQQGRLSTLEASFDGGSNYNELACIRDATFNLEQAEINATCRDDGEWEAFLQGRKMGTIDFNALWNEDDTYLMGVVNAYYDSTELYYRWRFRTGSGYRQYTASAIVTSVTKNAPNDDVATVDITLRINGAITDTNQP